VNEYQERVTRIIFWQPIASPHQEAFLESLAGGFQGEVILGVEQTLPRERVAQGWQEPTHTNVSVVDISIPANHAALASHTTSASLHVFSGFFSHRLVWDGFRKLAPSQARLAIFSEAPEQTLATGWLKRLRGRVLAARWADRFAFVLAIGGVGCEFFCRIGFPKEKIVPFGYAIDVPPLAAAVSSGASDGVVRLVSAGQLIRRKGIDLLLRACGELPATGWSLDIYGDGPERQSLEHRVRSQRLAERIIFHGAVSNTVVQESLARADCSVLPSRFDGWGMLVNESLAAGTPVICSASCGAAQLVSSARLGRVVPSGRITMLAEAMADAIAKGPVSWEDRVGIHAEALSCFSAMLAAERFVSLLDRAGRHESVAAGAGP